MSWSIKKIFHIFDKKKEEITPLIKKIEKTTSGFIIMFPNSSVEIINNQTFLHYYDIKNAGNINRSLTQFEIDNLNEDSIRTWLCKGR